jgi:hypothetical protein
MQNTYAATTTTTASTIDLTALDETTRAHILRLINPTSTTTPQTMPITQTPLPTYASVLTAPTTHTNITNATPITQHPTIQIPSDYHHEPNNMITIDDTDDDDETPFVLVTNKKQNKSKQQTTASNPTKDGISGVKAASTLLWNDKAAAIIMNNDDLQRQTIRLLEGRTPNVNSINRPVIWLKFWFPTELPNTSIPPNILQQELAIDHIISKAALDFIVDRVYIGTLLNPVHINDNTLSFLGFAALSPRTTNTTSNTIDKTTLHNLYTLEDRLHLITSDKNNYQEDNTSIPLLNDILFKLPHLNNYTEETTFLIKGLHQGIPNNDVASLRELAADIFRAIHQAHNTRYPNAKQPAVLQRHTSRFSINQIMSIRPWNITPNKLQKPNHSPPRNSSNNSSDRALIIILDPHSQAASDLERIITSLSTDHSNTLSICGGKIDINLIHFNTVPKSNSNTKEYNKFYQQLRQCNLLHYARTNVRIIREIPIHPRTLSNPDYINIIVQNIPNCRALIPNLEQGRRHPALTCLLNYSTEQTDSSPDTILELIATTAHTLLNIDITSTPSKQHQQTTSATTINSGAALTNNFTGYVLPQTVNTTSTAPRIYVLINVKGGLATAGIYKGHFDDNRLRLLTDKISYVIFKKFPTEAEAWTYFLSFYNDYNTYDKIFFLNYNCPVESSNLNNPCPRVQAEMSQMSTTKEPKKEGTFYRPDLMAPHIILARLAATERMISQKKSPADSYDFLPQDHPRTYQSPADLPINQALIPPSSANHPSSTNRNFAIEQCILELDEQQDDVSIMTEQTKTLYVNISQPQHIPLPSANSASKRARTSSERSISSISHHQMTKSIPSNPTTTYISLRTPIRMAANELLNQIIQHNTNDTIPKMAIGLDVSFAPTITNFTWKLAYLRINTPECTTDIMNLLNLHFHHFHPQLISSPSMLPTLITSIQTIDNSPPTHTHPNVPTNCRIKQCPLYNAGIEEPINDNDLDSFYKQMEDHGIGIHGELFERTPITTLESINWFQCCVTCNSLHFGDTSINTHRESCPIFNDKTMLDMNDEDDSSNILQTNKLSQTSLFDTCPPQYHTALQTLIDNNTPPNTINAQILRWISTSMKNNTAYTNQSNE